MTNREAWDTGKGGKLSFHMTSAVLMIVLTKLKTTSAYVFSDHVFNLSQKIWETQGKVELCFKEKMLAGRF